MTYLAQCVGSILGSIICSFVLERFPCEPQFAIGSGVIVLASIVSSFVDDIYSFSALRFFAFIYIGYLDSGKVHSYIKTYTYSPRHVQALALASACLTLNHKCTCLSISSHVYVFIFFFFCLVSYSLINLILLFVYLISHCGLNCITCNCHGMSNY